MKIQVKLPDELKRFERYKIVRALTGRPDAERPAETFRYWKPLPVFVLYRKGGKDAIDYVGTATANEPEFATVEFQWSKRLQRVQAAIRDNAYEATWRHVCPDAYGDAVAAGVKGWDAVYNNPSISGLEIRLTDGIDEPDDDED